MSSRILYLDIGLIECRVYVPEDDKTTTDFPCSCETYRRPLIVRGDASTSPVRTTGYSIASVFTLASYRRKGHAERMMTLLHEQLRLDGVPSVDAVVPGWQGGKDGIISFLYSDVGDFYARCGKPGWTINAPISTVWTAPYPSPTSSLRTNAITMETLAEVASLDASLLAQSLPPGSFSIEPSFENYEWAYERSAYYAPILGLTQPKILGAEIGTRGEADWGCILFFPNFAKGTVLKIVRIRANAGQMQALMEVAWEVGRSIEAKSMSAWNVGDELLGGLKGGERGATGVRKDSLSAVAWYGGGKPGEWSVNEAYAWC